MHGRTGAWVSPSLQHSSVVFLPSRDCTTDQTERNPLLTPLLQAMPVLKGVKFGANAFLHLNNFKQQYWRSCTPFALLDAAT